MSFHRPLIALVCTACIPAAPAGAQSGVTVDPGSPSGKEYAIPLDTARHEAAAGNETAPGAEGTASAPLFGEGVGDPSATDPSSSGAKPKRDSASKGQRPSRSKPAATTSPTASVPTVRRDATAVPESGSGSLLTIAAVALSVLVLGGVIGSIARRRGA